MDFDTVNRLVHQIYNPRASRRDWLQVLKQIADVCEVEAASIASGTRSQQLSIFCSSTDPELLEEYTTNWVQRDPTMPLLFASSPGEIMSLDRIGGQGAYEYTDVCNQFWSRTGHSPEHLRCKLFQSPDSWMVFAVNARVRDNEITNESAKAFSFFLPHLTQSAEIQRRLRSAILQKSADEFAPGSPGAMLVNARGRVLFFDAQSQDILEANNAISLKGGYIDLKSSEANARLMRQLHLCTSRAFEGHLLGEKLYLDGQRGLQIDVLPYSAQNRALGLELYAEVDPVALLLIDDPDKRYRETITRLRHAYGLTHTEAKVAIEAVSVGSRTALANRMGVSESTIKTHLTRIYDKTDTQRHVHLIQLISNHMVGSGLNV